MDGDGREMLGKDRTSRPWVRSDGRNNCAGRWPGMPARKNRNGKDRPEAIGCMLLSTRERKGNPHVDVQTGFYGILAGRQSIFYYSVARGP